MTVGWWEPWPYPSHTLWWHNNVKLVPLTTTTLMTLRGHGGNGGAQVISGAWRHWLVRVAFQMRTVLLFQRKLNLVNLHIYTVLNKPWDPEDVRSALLPCPTLPWHGCYMSAWLSTCCVSISIFHGPKWKMHLFEPLSAWPQYEDEGKLARSRGEARAMKIWRMSGNKMGRFSSLL